jgi:hypothetical protein
LKNILLEINFKKVLIIAIKTLFLIDITEIRTAFRTYYKPIYSNQNYKTYDDTSQKAGANATLPTCY